MTNKNPRTNAQGRRARFLGHWDLVICWPLRLGHWPPAPQQSGHGRRTVGPPPMDERIEKLAEKARGLPKAPGVYLMKDAKGRVIYVGKSASLRERVASYFQAATKLEARKAGLLDYVVDFEVIQTDSEV